MPDIGIRVVVQQVAEARRNIGAVQTDINGLSKTIEKVSGQSSDMGRTLTNVGSAMVGLGRTLTIAVTAPIAALGASLLEAGVQFEDAFAGVGKTVEGVMDSMGGLTSVGETVRQQFRDMALDVPIATNEIAKLGETVGQLGVNSDEVSRVTELVAKLGATTELSAEEAAKGIIRLGNILGNAGLSVEEFVSRAGSAIVALGNKSVSTEGEILNLSLRLAAAGDRANFSAQEVLAWATTLSDLGVRAEAGGTAVSRAINEMLLAVQAGSDNLETFASVAGVSVGEFQRLFEEDASGAVQQFITALESGIREGNITKAMLTEMGLGGVRAIDVIGRLGDASTIFAGNLATANKAWEEQVALQEEFNKRAATVQSQIQLLKNRFTDLGITVFDLVKDDLIKLIDGIGWMIDQFSNLDPSIQKTILTVAAFAAAVGPLLILIGGAVAALGTLVTAFTALISGPALAAAAVLAFVAALGSIYLPPALAQIAEALNLNPAAPTAPEAPAQPAIAPGDIAQARNMSNAGSRGVAPGSIQELQNIAAMPLPVVPPTGLEKVISDIKKWWADAVSFVSSLPIVDMFSKSGIMESLQELTGVLLPGLKGTLDGIGQGIANFATGFQKGFSPFVDDMGPATEEIFAAIKSLIDEITPLLEELFGVEVDTGGMKDFGQVVGELTGASIVAGLHAIAWAFTAIRDAIVFFEDAGNKIMAFEVMVSGIPTKIGDAFNSMVALVQGAGDSIRAAMDGLMASLVGESNWARLQEVPGKLGEMFVALVTIAGQKSAEIGQAIIGALTGIAGLLGLALSSAGDALVNTLSQWFGPVSAEAGKVTKGIADAFSPLTSWLSPIFNTAVSAITSIFGSLYTSLVQTVSTITGGISGGFTTMVSIVKGVVQGLIDDLLDLFDSLYMALVGGSIVPDMVNGIINSFTNLKNTVVQLASDLFTGALGFFTDLASKAGDILKNLFQGGGATATFDTSQVDNMTTAIDNLKSKLTEVQSTLATLGGSFATVLAMPAVTAFTALTTTMQTLWTATTTLMQAQLQATSASLTMTYATISLTFAMTMAAMTTSLQTFVAGAIVSLSAVGGILAEVENQVKEMSDQTQTSMMEARGAVQWLSAMFYNLAAAAEEAASRIENANQRIVDSNNRTVQESVGSPYLKIQGLFMKLEDYLKNTDFAFAMDMSANEVGMSGLLSALMPASTVSTTNVANDNSVVVNGASIQNDRSLANMIYQRQQARAG